MDNGNRKCPKWGNREPGAPNLLLDPPLALVGHLQVFPCLFLGTLSIILGADCQVVLTYSALPLATDIEDLAEIDVAPDLSPLRIQVAGQRFAERVRRLLVIVLQEVHLGDSVVRQRAV